MLSEHDRRTLRAIERGLLAEDAAFGRQFDADLRPHRPTRPTGLGRHSSPARCCSDC